MPNRIETLIETESRRAKKVEQLIALLRDPDVADFVAKLMVGEPSQPLVLTPQTPKGNPRSLRGIIRDLELPTRFTSTDVLTRVEGKYSFNGHDRADKLRIVRDAIYNLSRGEGQVFRIVTPSTGGTEQVYERM